MSKTIKEIRAAKRVANKKRRDANKTARKTARQTTQADIKTRRTEQRTERAAARTKAKTKRANKRLDLKILKATEKGKTKASGIKRAEKRVTRVSVSKDLRVANKRTARAKKKQDNKATRVNKRTLRKSQRSGFKAKKGAIKKR